MTDGGGESFKIGNLDKFISFIKNVEYNVVMYSK